MEISRKPIRPGTEINGVLSIGRREDLSLLHHLEVRARKPACAACGGWHPGPSLDRALRKLGAVTVGAYAVTAQYVNIFAILQSAGPNPLQVDKECDVICAVNPTRWQWEELNSS